jgi:hypothetical protein
MPTGMHLNAGGAFASRIEASPFYLRKMKRILLLILLVFILTMAYFTRPDDKTCIIKAVQTVWGNRTPDIKKTPGYFEQFMDVTSPSVEVNDWIFLKRIRYQFGQEKKTVGFGLFNRFYML